MSHEMRCVYIVRIGMDWQYEQWHTESVRRLFEAIKKPVQPHTFPKWYLKN